MSKRFPVRTFVTTAKESITGEFVCETSEAYQVAVKGTVRLLKKDTWFPSDNRWANLAEQFEDILGL